MTLAPLRVLFSLYTYLPPKPPVHPSARTFCILPAEAKDAAHWLRASNGLAENEIDAHTGMFAGRTNDGYYQLGLDTVAVVRAGVWPVPATITHLASDQGSYHDGTWSI
jgi:hypothetical protein